MNDFSELENDLRALRPARPSPVLFERIEEAMAENCRASVSDAGSMAKWRWRFTETPYRFGIGLVAAAAAVVLLLARINTDQTRNEDTEIAQGSPSSQTKPILPSFSGRSGVDGSMSSVCVPPFTFNVILLILRAPYELGGRADVTEVILSVV